MNPRMFQSQQNKAKRLARPIAPAVSMTTQEDSLEVKHIAPDRSSATTASNLVEQNALLREKAFCEIQQGNDAAAIALLSVLLERNPTSVNDYNNRGLLYAQNGQFSHALADYYRALRLSPRSAKIYNNRANCYASMGRPVEALFDYETALDLNPTNIHARINQGITFRELEMYEHAIENFDLAFQLDQMLTGSLAADMPRSLLGHIYAQRGRTSHVSGDWNYAVADYRRALKVLSPIDTVLLNQSQRLRLQVEGWLDKLLNP